MVFCPNIGVLSMAVLSIIPLLRPYSWQSLMLPILPDNESMLHLLDAPVPFVIGIQVWPPYCCGRHVQTLAVLLYHCTASVLHGREMKILRPQSSPCIAYSTA